ncbi:MAG TPA: hypothetical protein VLV85_17255 [Stellaceae bacterium]|jgi:hypothetical protein|nr:hypothetical protein [Stellaceae bacterium]
MMLSVGTSCLGSALIYLRCQKGKERVDAAATYRRKAAQLREKAKGARDPVVHQELLSLAEQYETLAKRAESETDGTP